MRGLAPWDSMRAFPRISILLGLCFCFHTAWSLDPGIGPGRGIDQFLQMMATEGPGDPEDVLLLSVAASLAGEDPAALTGELATARMTLIRRLQAAIKKRWEERPRTWIQVKGAVATISRDFFHLLRELPPEIAARALSGYHEFGILYLMVVVTTFPPWLFLSESVEHAVLGAPLGLACTHLQLGYFVVIASMMAPASSLCQYVSKDLKKTSWFQKLKAAPRNLALAWQDYLKLRILRKNFQTLKTTDGILRHTQVLRSKIKDHSNAWIQSLARDPFLWKILVGHVFNQSDVFQSQEIQPSQELVRSELVWLKTLRFLLAGLNVETKLLHEAERLNFRTYNSFLKVEAFLSRKLRENFILQRKADPAEKTNFVQEFLSIFRRYRELQKEAWSLGSDTLKEKMDAFYNGIHDSCSLNLAKRPHPA
jgi:hypothetical protein